jgi:hypothetical protein
VKFVAPFDAPGFVARPGVWVGARIGVFVSGPGAEAGTAPRGHADFEWFRVFSVFEG